MINKCSVVEIDDTCLVKHEVKRGILKTKHKSDNYNLDVLKNIYLDIKHRRTTIIVEEEEINIKLLTLPKTKREALYDLIKNELCYYFKDLESIVFNYTIFKEHKNSVEIIVFCMNERKISLVQRCLSSSVKIKGFYAIQLCFLNYFQKDITEKNFSFVFKHRNCIYFLYCLDNKLINNSMHKIIHSDFDFTVLLYNFVENSKILCGGEISTIYFVDNEYMKSRNDKDDNFTYISLGELKEEQLIDIFVEKRS
jgi:hypothetical protein